MASIITQQLEQRIKLQASINRKFLGGYICLEDFVLQNGFQFSPAQCPDEFADEAQPKACFKNAMILAIEHGLIYVEGYATISVGIAVNHAWCVSPDTNLVIDPTWKYDNNTEYFGVPIKTQYIIESFEKSQQYSVIDNWEKRWPILTDSKDLWEHDYRPPVENHRIAR